MRFIPITTQDTPHVTEPSVDSNLGNPHRQWTALLQTSAELQAGVPTDARTYRMQTENYPTKRTY